MGEWADLFDPQGPVLKQVQAQVQAELRRSEQVVAEASQGRLVFLREVVEECRDPPSSG